MFALLILVLVGFSIAKLLTTTYRFQLARMVRDRSDLQDVFVEALGQNTYDYFVQVANLYDACRVPFTIKDFFFRPSSSKEYSIAFYGANLLLLLWWVLIAAPTITQVIALCILIGVFEYISYWRDTFFRTVNNVDFKNYVMGLYEQYRPTDRMG